MSKAQLVSFDVEATVGDAVQALTFEAKSQCSSGLSLSSQTDAESGRGDDMRVFVRPLGVGATGDRMVAMLGVRTTDLW